MISVHQSQKSNNFFFSIGIINDTGTCIIYQNEADSLWITSLLLNMVTFFSIAMMHLQMRACIPAMKNSVDYSLSHFITAVFTSSSLA